MSTPSEQIVSDTIGSLASSSSPLSPQTSSNKKNEYPRKRQLNDFVSTLISSCLCNGVYHFKARTGMSPSTQIIELKGIRFIGLGAVVDELTPRERVYDTLEVFRTRTECLVSVGYILDKELVDSTAIPRGTAVDVEKVVEALPLESWNRDFPDESRFTKETKKTIDLVQVRCLER